MPHLSHCSFCVFFSSGWNEQDQNPAYYLSPWRDAGAWGMWKHPFWLQFGILLHKTAHLTTVNNAWNELYWL